MDQFAGGSGIRMKISSSSSLLSRRMSTTTNDNSSSAAGTGAGAASTGGGGLSSVGHMRRMSHPLFTSMDATEHRFTFYCLVCLEQHSDPFELDCHHIFCEPCLRIYRDIFLNDACTSVSNVTDSGSAGVDGFRARCPTCRRSADISDSSARVESPPGEKLSNGLAENVSAARRKISRTSLMDQNLKCDSCLAASGVNVLFQGGAAIVGGTVGGANGIDIAGADGYLMMNAQRNGLVPSYNLANGETATTPPATLDGHIKLSSDVAQSLGRGMSVMGAFSVEDADFHCSKCEMNLCKMCRARHDSQSVFRGHTVVNITSREAVQLYCYAHSMGGTGRRRACLFYCADCNRLECVICVLRDNPQHRAVKLRDAVAERRDSLKTLLNTLGPRLDRLEARVNQLKKMYNERRMNRVSAMSNVRIRLMYFFNAVRTRLQYNVRAT
jgi:hypothetical protein